MFMQMLTSLIYSICVEDKNWGKIKLFTLFLLWKNTDSFSWCTSLITVSPYFKLSQSADGTKLGRLCDKTYVGLQREGVLPSVGGGRRIQRFDMISLCDADKHVESCAAEYFGEGLLDSIPALIGHNMVSRRALITHLWVPGWCLMSG